MISYAQNFEDVILARTFRGISSGFYIDVGAWDPTVDSVTRHFYDSGWSGINIEPNPLFYEKLVLERPRDINLNCAVSDAPEGGPFYVFDDTGTSTFDKGISDYFSSRFSVREIKAPTRTLTDIVRDVSRDITFLKIDVEGWERQVIRSLDWTQFRPLVILLEAVDQTGNPTWSSWEDLLFRESYDFAYFDGLNRFYVTHERSDLIHLLSTPPNVFDDFILHREQLVRQQLDECRSQHAITQEEIEVSRAELQSYVLNLEKARSNETVIGKDRSESAVSLSNYVRGVISTFDAYMEVERRTVRELSNANAALRLWAGEIEQTRAIEVATSSSRHHGDHAVEFKTHDR